MTDTPSSPPLSPQADDNALVPVQDAPKKTAKRRCCRVIFLIALVLGSALAAAGWFGYQQWQMLRAQWSAQLTQSQAAAEVARTQAQRALAALQTQTAQLAKLQADQARTAAQLQSLEQVVDAIPPAAGKDSPAMLLGEVGRLVEIAQQSVRLSGDVNTALLALQSAQTRLASHGPWSELTQALGEDIARLRAVPVVDMVLLASQLDDVSALLRQAPLLLPETLSATVPAEAQDQDSAAQRAPDALTLPTDSAADDSVWWRSAWQQTKTWSQQAWQAVAQDVRGLVDVRRVDDATALLMSPDQAAMLRDTLQHRVAAARLALLMRAPTLWTAELTALHDALAVRFDRRQATVQQAQALVQNLLQTTIRVDLPALDVSVRAVERQREIWSRAQQDVQSASESSDSALVSTDSERS